jgi:hypothetical protein
MEKTPEELESVRRLIALKRHETPPPGYFRDFSRQVIARIEREERARPEPWWGRFGAFLDWRPALLGANALIVAGLGLLAVTAVVVQNSRSAPETAGTLPPFSQASAGLGVGLTHSPASFSRDNGLPLVSVRYQLPEYPADSNQVPSIRVQPVRFPVIPAAANGGR